MTYSDDLLNLAFRMVQVQISRSIQQSENDARDRKRSPIVEGEEQEEHQRKVKSQERTEVEQKDQNEKKVIEEAEANPIEQKSTSQFSDSRRIIVSREIGQLWRKDFNNVKTLDLRDKERAIQSRKWYGLVVMLIFAIWLIFVGVIVIWTMGVLAEEGKTLSSWTLSVLIASPSGILVVVFRILFPP